ncbi:RDD family protein [uncultured Methanobrevibacter sp.]|uniref:RDD family protein n=1 Tax=uncultured Methanobrevibacter sp. TaxID=253161 RepID=UPI0025D001FD|nr:RDD family protein [uncultured Methanobrevibacter sp.]
MVSMTTKRFIAYILDFLVVFAIMWPISYFLFLFANPVFKYQVYHYFPITAPIIIIIYFVFCEKIRGATVGKLLTFIEVQNEEGERISYKQAIFRNISKLWWIFIIFDYLMGMLYGSKDDRLLGQLSHTKVVNEDKSKFDL